MLPVSASVAELLLPGASCALMLTVPLPVAPRNGPVPFVTVNGSVPDATGLFGRPEMLSGFVAQLPAPNSRSRAPPAAEIRTRPVPVGTKPAVPPALWTSTVPVHRPASEPDDDATPLY